MKLLKYDDAVKRLQSGDTIFVTLRNSTIAGDRDRFSFKDSHGGVSQPTFRKLHPHLRPLRDGLFPGELSQTFAWR